MLFNPEWKKETIAFTLPHFIAWLETMPPKKSYEFSNCQGRCLMGQYMAANGMGWTDDNYREACDGVFGHWLRVPVLIQSPHTFGAALDRARKALVA